MKRFLPILIISLFALTACENKISTDPQAQLLFSVDTLCFDTVFTGMGSTTRRVMVRNPQKEKLIIEQVKMTDGQYFDINLDGENDMSRLKDIEIRGKDSLYLFVRANINPQDANSPVLIEDEILFSVNGTLHTLPLQAYGQDVEILRNHFILRDTVLQGDKPYLVYDTLYVGGDLTIKENTTFYMHDGACLICLGDVNAVGTLDSPIRFQGDRIDKVLPDVPYSIVTGKWNGIYLLQLQDALKQRFGKKHFTYNLNYVEVQSGTVGLYCYAQTPDKPASMTLQNSLIHNMALYGLVLQNANANVYNSQISNCANFCLYLAGGKHTFVHNSIVSNFQGMNIQPVSRDDVAAVYINNLSKETTDEDITFYNNIITGTRANQLVVATPLPDYFQGIMQYNYLKTDSLTFQNCTDNVYYQQDDELFVEPYYNATTHSGYDFRLDSLSAARGIANSEITKKYKLTLDRLGATRPTDTAEEQPDAGCYQWQSAQVSQE